MSVAPHKIGIWCTNQKVRARHHYPVVKDRCARKLVPQASRPEGRRPVGVGWILATHPRGVNPMLRKNLNGWSQPASSRAQLSFARLAAGPKRFCETLSRIRQTQPRGLGFSSILISILSLAQGLVACCPEGMASTTIPLDDEYWNSLSPYRSGLGLEIR